MKSLIKNLVETSGPSGYESQVRELIQKNVEPLVDHMKVDNLGNLIVQINSDHENASKLMLSAHMDEIGVIATHIDKNGFVRFTNIGGVRPEACPGGHVRFLNGTIGVIGTEKNTDLKEKLSFENMFIDVGVTQKDECPVSIGDVAAFERTFIDMGKRLVSKAMDDRIGIAVLIRTIQTIREQNIKPAQQTFFVFSTQEEVGLRGATTAAYGINPDLGIAIDVTATGDTPRGGNLEIGLGKGPAIKVRDGGMLADPRVIKWMVNSAESEAIPYQLEVLERGTTDARAMQLARSGVPVGCLSIPCRYIHAPSEMIDYNDVEQTIRLLVALLSKPVNLVLE
jgi:tetrahedral aminopeptidase